MWNRYILQCQNRWKQSFFKSVPCKEQIICKTLLLFKNSIYEMGHSLVSLVFVQYCAVLDSAVPVTSCLLGSLCMWRGETLVLSRMLSSVWYITITFAFIFCCLWLFLMTVGLYQWQYFEKGQLLAIFLKQSKYSIWSVWRVHFRLRVHYMHFILSIIKICGLRVLTFHAEELRYISSEWIADTLISGHLQNIVLPLYIGGFAFLSAF